MAKDKQHVFSARTTGEGLRRLNELKEKLGVSWDDLVIDAVSAHYGLDRATLAVPKREKPAKEAKSGEQQPPIEQTAEEKPAKKRGKGKGKK